MQSRSEPRNQLKQAEARMYRPIYNCTGICRKDDEPQLHKSREIRNWFPEESISLRIK